MKPNQMTLLIIAALFVSAATHLFSHWYYQDSETEKLKTAASRLENELAETKMLLKQAQKRMRTLSDLTDKVDELNDRLDHANARLKSVEIDQGEYDLRIDYSRQDAMKALHMIRNLPQVSNNLAFIQDASAEGDTLNLSLDYVEWLTGEEAREVATKDNKLDEAALENGYYVRNMQIENDPFTFNIFDTLIFILDGASVKHADYSQILNDPASLNERLFHVYFVDNKLLILQEQYRP